jgi:hypothetical protein
MNDASLDFYRRKDLFDSITKSGKSIDTGNEDIINSPVREIITDFLPKRSTFCVTDIESNDFFDT